MSAQVPLVRPVPDGGTRPLCEHLRLLLKFEAQLSRLLVPTFSRNYHTDAVTGYRLGCLHLRGREHRHPRYARTSSARSTRVQVWPAISSNASMFSPKTIRISADEKNVQYLRTTSRACR